MESADIEIISKLTLGPFSQRQHLELADLVCERLPRVADVAINLVNDVVFCLCRVFL